MAEKKFGDTSTGGVTCCLHHDAAVDWSVLSVSENLKKKKKIRI